ncbi:hypothetical protein E2C01_017956 [Portunus trituberculatus]|uniref:Uncharacterized protein n=1 Tax=Portunus trituberculatus TaxID=210409 RepID=A0A5B7DT96_PORTR|nr:hypothetical protein [Portunus trituberculatus]
MVTSAGRRCGAEFTTQGDRHQSPCQCGGVGRCSTPANLCVGGGYNQHAPPPPSHPTAAQRPRLMHRLL